MSSRIISWVLFLYHEEFSNILIFLEFSINIGGYIAWWNILY